MNSANDAIRTRIDHDDFVARLHVDEDASRRSVALHVLRLAAARDRRRCKDAAYLRYCEHAVDAGRGDRLDDLPRPRVEREQLARVHVEIQSRCVLRSKLV